MGARFKTIEREQGLLLPYNLKDWIQDDDMVHFIIEAAAMVPMEKFSINQRGTGSEQYHPHMLLALLLYCYSHGIFSSRKIEQATYHHIAVRYLCGNTHPDHDTICTFRVRNEEAVKSSFLHILKLAKEMGVLKVGTVSVDGSKINANASIHKSLRYDRAVLLEKQLKQEIDRLLEKAKKEDENDDDHLKGDLKRLSSLREKMQKAQKKLEEQAKKKDEKNRAEYLRKLENREKRASKRGVLPKEPETSLKDSNQVNLTDSDSRIMRKNRRSSYTQSYNAQSVVDADGTMLILGARVTNNSVDCNELEIDIDSVPDEIGIPKTILADSGYGAEEPVCNLLKRGMDVLVAIKGQSENPGRRFDFRPPKTKATEKKAIKKQWKQDMAEKMTDPKNRKLYALRKQTVEPVFGVIKQALGFRQFLLRGLDKVNLEWMLVASAYNLKRLANLR